MLTSGRPLAERRHGPRQLVNFHLSRETSQLSGGQTTEMGNCGNRVHVPVSILWLATPTHTCARAHACISRVYPPFNLRVNRESLRSSFPSGGKLSPATCKTISAERRRKYTADLTRFTRHIYAHQRYRIRRLCLTRPLVERPLPPREGVTRISGGSESFRRCITDGYSCTFKARASPSSRL